MLNTESRIARYEAQNGSERLTPKQIRRARKKRNAQSPEAQTNRAAAHSQRMALIEARKTSGLLPR